MWHSQGKITVAAAGTPIRVTTTRTPAQTILFQQVAGNTAKLWICSSATAVTATGVDVLATIPAPTTSGGIATVLPYVSITIPNSPCALDLARFWIDADVNGEACQVSYVVL